MCLTRQLAFIDLMQTHGQTRQKHSNILTTNAGDVHAQQNEEDQKEHAMQWQAAVCHQHAHEIECKACLLT